MNVFSVEQQRYKRHCAVRKSPWGERSASGVCAVHTLGWPSISYRCAEVPWQLVTEKAELAKFSHLFRRVTLTTWYTSPRSTCQYWLLWLLVVAHMLAWLLLSPSLASPADRGPAVLLCLLPLPALSKTGASGLPTSWAADGCKACQWDGWYNLSAANEGKAC